MKAYKKPFTLRIYRTNGRARLWTGRTILKEKTDNSYINICTSLINGKIFDQTFDPTFE